MQWVVSLKAVVWFDILFFAVGMGLGLNTTQMDWLSRALGCLCDRVPSRVFWRAGRDRASCGIAARWVVVI